MTYLKNKLAAIEKAIKEYEGDSSIYARRKVLQLNKLAEKTEQKIKQL
tara:strand:+ start:75 stop:218 length:144 start_codon:yes stop_codon:yes gene_type:complete